jgi:hypothetical protein
LAPELELRPVYVGVLRVGEVANTFGLGLAGVVGIAWIRPLSMVAEPHCNLMGSCSEGGDPTDRWEPLDAGVINIPGPFTEGVLGCAIDERWKGMVAPATPTPELVLSGLVPLVVSAVGDADSEIGGPGLAGGLPAATTAAVPEAALLGAWKALLDASAGIASVRTPGMSSSVQLWLSPGLAPLTWREGVRSSLIMETDLKRVEADGGSMEANRISMQGSQLAWNGF